MTLTNRNRAQQIIVRVALLAVLVALAVASRMGQVVCCWLPPNFHAVAGTALFAGFLFRGRAVALVVPFAAMWLSDQILGGYDRLVMTAVYGSLAAPVLVGHWLDRRLSARRVVGASLAASTLFFLVTNAAVWWAWYPHSGEGLVRCFARAVPFFAYTLSGDLVFACGLFGLYSLLAADARRPAGALAPADSRPVALPV